MYKKIIAFFLGICISVQVIPAAVYAQENTSAVSESESDDVPDENVIDVSSIIALRQKTIENILDQSKFRASQGHGFAAERGNNLIDRIRGKNAIIVGDSNVKNGADRLIINRDGTKIWIQDKYYQSAKAGIDACFDETGTFRYIDGDGNPMLIEVPSDQYDDSVKYLSEKIKEGKIPGITDPDEAGKLVKKGSLSYKQAVNLAKAGTIESLTYDDVHGTVSAASAFGISTVLNYAVNRLNGVSREEAIRSSVKEGLKTGLLMFGTSVIASQLTKTGIVDIFKPSSEALVKTFGKNFAEALAQSAGKNGVKLTAEQTVKNAAKVLRTNAIFDAVALVVFSIPDAIDLFQGRISKKQFIKNFAVAAVAIVAGTAGYAAGAVVGNLIVPGVGTIPGGIVGSILAGGVGGIGAELLADHIVDDDAEEMYGITEKCFVQKCEDYIIDEKGAENIIAQFQEMLTEDMFKDMYQSEDREQFINEKMDPLFVQEAAKREKITVPTDDEMREALKIELKDIVFIH